MTDEDYIMLSYATSYLMYFALLFFSSLHQSNRLFYKNGFANNLVLLLILHICGIFLFGIVPYFSNHLSSAVFFAGQKMETWSTWLSIILIFFILIISPGLARREYNANKTYVANTTCLNSFFITFYFIIRILFIIAYEMWFRGFLLNDSIAAFGSLTAVLLNVSLYTIIHIVNGKKEVLSCIPFGLLLCYLCIWQGAVWPAIAIHLSLTISYEVSMTNNINYKPINHEGISNRGIGIHR